MENQSTVKKEKQRSEQEQMRDLFVTVISQWSLMNKSDVVLELVVLGSGSWGLSSARRLTHSEEDLSMTEFLRKGDEHGKSDQNYFG